MGSTMALPDKQREGVYGTARQMATCLKNEKIAACVKPSGPNDPRRQFTPEDFIQVAASEAAHNGTRVASASAAATPPVVESSAEVPAGPVVAADGNRWSALVKE